MAIYVSDQIPNLYLKWYYDENHYLSHFETGSHYEKNAVYYFKKSLSVPEIFKFLKHRN